jgi:hypothetical protein
MRKHMTHAEQLRIKKLLKEGVTDIAQIQQEVFIHASCIQGVIDHYGVPAGEASAAPKRRRKKVVAEVDPLS